MPLFFAGGLFGFALLCLWVFCIIDVVRTPESDMRNLPKLVWLFIVIFLPDVGSIVWLLLGRPTAPSLPREARHQHMNSYPEYDRPGRFAATSPDDDAEFLQGLRARAEEQRKRAADQRREAELREEQENARRRAARDETQ